MIKKKLGVLVIAAMFISSSFVASAQTTDSAATIAALQTQIQTLLTQVAALQSQIAQMTTRQQQIQSDVQNIRDTFNLYLSTGSSGDEVKSLQELLAQDPTLYPEGLITGYYGSLTARAIMRFQARHGIEQAGVVGPKTRAQLNELFLKINKKIDQEISKAIQNGMHDAFSDDNMFDDDDDDDDDMMDDGHWQNGNKNNKVTLCHNPNTSARHTIIVAGAALKAHLKHGDTQGVCGGGGDTSMSTPDSNAPVLSDISVSVITYNSASVSWRTDELANSAVRYSGTLPLTDGASATSSVVVTTNHKLILTNLAPTTSYYFVVISKDDAGHTATSSVHSFDTLSEPDISTPMISVIQVVDITDTAARVTWSTNESANSRVRFDASLSLSGGSDTVSQASLVTSHSVPLTGLASSTVYYYEVSSSDIASNTATSSIYMFTTAAPDTIAPVISSIEATSTTAIGADIVWATNEAADGIVWYGTTTPITTINAFGFAHHVNFVTSHTLSLTGLTASTTYYYLVGAKDSSGNQATSTEKTFMTE
ncbi:MAG: hypothetical protein COZ49_02445 [Candidatus Yonathbacteria bacterium CG_4_10_14_3_um_filter_47_65]|uniref:Fibronectin type-III domain-containing protein n=2 Tax=Parcubacteria group TaxID=1794811 RepID=A0A2M8D660_9BACT|nr:MAG: hypothetical protein AUJ44_00060 [Candidatus Nomurabacteria bacterium CG1_02_47_685]PIP03280.1 MAG: hypothetical protein COX54_04270 [Candidatus Yonathbacteria bacterium CG23_combo_of_CG06-09_8_20_14_all_46_18]PIQ32085.1 MAG: hypothetical protein COW61_02360 [Candidatus Yonathbacteria bacterium CG17_big_fil_post_rev_8_21_14_2_50_46_19]PIX56386.1 MAG: hypothetical protein COZ49_02445 [Candidatus Yonathbacteria bacterium CG_4_10_14_3_um_filter_47_65]PIY57373.1 MAG: hypothetical protein CO